MTPVALSQIDPLTDTRDSVEMTTFPWSMFLKKYKFLPTAEMTLILFNSLNLLVYGKVQIKTLRVYNYILSLVEQSLNSNKVIQIQLQLRFSLYKSFGRAGLF